MYARPTSCRFRSVRVPFVPAVEGSQKSERVTCTRGGVLSTQDFLFPLTPRRSSLH
jgi:hypothetical protein